MPCILALIFPIISLYPSFATACPDEYREGINSFEFVTQFLMISNNTPTLYLKRCVTDAEPTAPRFRTFASCNTSVGPYRV